MPRGQTASPLNLQARRQKAFDLFRRGYSNAQVARDVQVSEDTAARYRKRYEKAIQEQAKSNPDMLRDVLGNTLRTLQELEDIRSSAWRDYEAATSPQAKAAFLKLGLAALSERAKLFGLLGVKQEFVIHVQQVKAQQDKLVEFMSEHLCERDRDTLEEFVMREFRSELATIPETEEQTYDRTP